MSVFTIKLLLRWIVLVAADSQLQLQQLLADRRLLSTVAFMLLCCVRRRLSVVSTEYIVAKRYVLKQKLLLTAIGSHIIEIDWYPNE